MHDYALVIESYVIDMSTFGDIALEGISERFNTLITAIIARVRKIIAWIANRTKILMMHAKDIAFKMKENLAHKTDKLSTDQTFVNKYLLLYCKRLPITTKNLLSAGDDYICNVIAMQGNNKAQESEIQSSEARFLSRVSDVVNIKDEIETKLTAVIKPIPGLNVDGSATEPKIIKPSYDVVYECLHIVSSIGKGINDFMRKCLEALEKMQKAKDAAARQATDSDESNQKLRVYTKCIGIVNGILSGVSNSISAINHISNKWLILG